MKKTLLSEELEREILHDYFPEILNNLSFEEIKILFREFKRDYEGDNEMFEKLCVHKPECRELVQKYYNHPVFIWYLTMIYLAKEWQETQEKIQEKIHFFRQLSLQKYNEILTLKC